ncbi:VOC family protein [Octadecabacter sp. G9-8]|uniref:VOC family protein n=1 Tax=Octadecabacter dasysiphoniae TaxID=2909341 RepID=A0ABS9CUS9_9RHOB|nr:VOC family protein [Octadecabacter dasysiphoniae]MCF2871010.1 VOC family protein [Octadecabacter dasysiphoniae]
MTFQPMTAWIEIPVTDLDASAKFYDAVFGWTSQKITDMGPNPIVVLNGADEAGGGHLYPGTPAANSGSTVHLTVTDTVEATAARATKAGGQVMGPIVDIPSGRFQYMTDLDGNSIGMFELKAA